MREYKIEISGKTFILNEKELYSTQVSNFCIKLEKEQIESVLNNFKKDGAIITKI